MLFAREKGDSARSPSLWHLDLQHGEKGAKLPVTDEEIRA
jgi:hypothetical protein